MKKTSRVPNTYSQLMRGNTKALLSVIHRVDVREKFLQNTLNVLMISVYLCVEIFSLANLNYQNA